MAARVFFKRPFWHTRLVAAAQLFCPFQLVPPSHELHWPWSCTKFPSNPSLALPSTAQSVWRDEWSFRQVQSDSKLAELRWVSSAQDGSRVLLSWRRRPCHAYLSLCSVHVAVASTRTPPPPPRPAPPGPLCPDVLVYHGSQCWSQEACRFHVVPPSAAKCTACTFFIFLSRSLDTRTLHCDRATPLVVNTDKW